MFKVGERVVGVSWASIIANQVGTVVLVEEDGETVLVAFDKPVTIEGVIVGHTGNGSIPDGYGWYVYNEGLRLYDGDDGDYDCDDFDPVNKFEKHENICKQLNKIYREKNADYGDSFGETYKKLGIISAITRITDKVNRLQNLCINENQVNESMEDTLTDLANYAIMTLIELENMKVEWGEINETKI